MRKTLSIYTFAFILITILIRILMDVLFINYIVEKWEYQGFFLDVNYQKVFFSYLALIMLLYLLNFYSKRKFSHFFVLTLFYTMYLPIGVIYGYMNKSTEFFIIVNISFFLLAFIIILFNRTSIETVNYKNESTKLIPILIIISIYTFIAMTVQNLDHINIGSVLDFSKVYSVRELTTYHWGMTYLFTWQTKVINPYMIAISIKNKRKVLTFIFITFQIWLFILTGHKLVIFTLFIILIIIKFASKLDNYPFLLTRGIFSLFVLSVIEFLIYSNSILVDQLIRRVFYFPALLSFYYYEFFNAHGFQYWKYSFLGRIMNARTDFDILPSFVIGEYYFNNIHNNAVTGYLGSEYMNGGVIGVLLATLLIIALFIIIDKYVEKFNKELVLITFIAPLYTLWNTNLLTAFISGGILISLLIFSQTKKIKNT